MTVILSVSLERALVREMLRRAGSVAGLVYYTGPMPKHCEDQATGEKLGRSRAAEEAVRSLAAEGRQPDLVPGAGYWRVLDNNGDVVMQGDGT